MGCLLCRLPTTKEMKQWRVLTSQENISSNFSTCPSIVRLSCYYLLFEIKSEDASGRLSFSTLRKSKVNRKIKTSGKNIFPRWNFLGEKKQRERADFLGPKSSDGRWSLKQAIARASDNGCPGQQMPWETGEPWASRYLRQASAPYLATSPLSVSLGIGNWLIPKTGIFVCFF